MEILVLLLVIGVVVFAAGSDAHLAGPLPVGLAPFDLVFDAADHEVTGVPPEVDARGVSLSSPWPNPARAEIRLALRVEVASRVEAGVFDLAGRRVRDLPVAAGAGERVLSWDLRDDAGIRVAAGIYLVRVQVAGRSWVRRVVVAP